MMMSLKTNWKYITMAWKWINAFVDLIGRLSKCHRQWPIKNIDFKKHVKIAFAQAMNGD